MARTRGSHDIASKVRGAFLRAAKMCEEDGRPISLILAEQLKERPLETLRTIAQFVPKEMLIEADITSSIEDMSDDDLRRYTEQIGRQIGIPVCFAGTEETLQ